MALTDILIKLREKIDIKIICAHVNHNVRKESKEEAQWQTKRHNRRRCGGRSDTAGGHCRLRGSPCEQLRLL